MRTMSVVGIGAGNPEHITVQAISTLNDVDVVFMMDKVMRPANSSSSAGRSASGTSPTLPADRDRSRSRAPPWPGGLAGRPRRTGARGAQRSTSS